MGQLQKCRITLEDQEEALISPQISNGSWSSEPKNSSNMPSQAILATELFETLVTVIWLFSWMY